MNPKRISVLVSGTGSNLQALIDARDSGRLPARLVHVISNRAAAPALERARRAHIPCSVLEQGHFPRREDFDRALALLIAAEHPDLVILAGFMRILGPPVLGPFAGRLVNLHPSLLPRHRGTDTYQRALQAGDREHGASIHFVTAELDGGPVISQVRIPVEPGDDPGRLAARLAPREHALVVATAELFCRASVECRDERVLLDGAPLPQPLQLQADDRLAA